MMAMSLVNLFPQAPQGEAALLKLAELAQTQGKTAEARHLFGLITSLAPGTPVASQASWRPAPSSLPRTCTPESAVWPCGSS